MRKPITLLEVAKKAQVSPATVSRTLNNPRLVNNLTRAKVEKAVSEFGYVANSAARNLRQQRNNALLLMVPTVGAPFFTQVLTGIEQIASQHGYAILIAHTIDQKENTQHFIDYAHHNRADGVITFGGNDNYAQLQQTGNGYNLPIIAVNEKANQTNVPSVMVDGFQAAKQVTQYLIDLGHTKLGHIAGPIEHTSSALERQKGFIDTLANYHLQPTWIFSAQYNTDSGILAANHWVTLDNKPTAIFCSCDEVAFGFISTITRHGFQVPKDVSVVGFDDIPLAGFAVPTITTIRQPYISIGETAVRILLTNIDGEKIITENTYLAGELIIRESTARNKT